MTENEERRRVILRAAERLLEHYGLAKTTVADIAREAAIGVGTVYLEFGSKDDIISHVAGARHREMLESLRRLAQSEGLVIDRLRAVLDARVRMFREFAACGTHARELVHCRRQPVEASWEGYKEGEVALVGELLREGAELGELTAVDTPVVARAVLDAYASFAPPWRACVDADEDARLLAMHELILRGLRK